MHVSYMLQSNDIRHGCLAAPLLWPAPASCNGCCTWYKHCCTTDTAAYSCSQQLYTAVYSCSRRVSLTSQPGVPGSHLAIPATCNVHAVSTHTPCLPLDPWCAYFGALVCLLWTRWCAAYLLDPLVCCLPLDPWCAYLWTPGVPTFGPLVCCLPVGRLVCCFLQEAAVAAVSGEDVMESQAEDMLSGSQGSNTASGLSASQGSSREESEVARFGAAKEKKHSLENGITVFNRSCCSPVFTVENRRLIEGLYRCTEECYRSVYVLVLVLITKSMIVHLSCARIYVCLYIQVHICIYIYVSIYMHIYVRAQEKGPCLSSLWHTIVPCSRPVLLLLEVAAVYLPL